MVVQHGCPINRQNPHTGMTPLHWACYHGNMALMELLLSHGADPSLLTVNDEFGKLPIDLAGISIVATSKPHNLHTGTYV